MSIHTPLMACFCVHATVCQASPRQNYILILSLQLFFFFVSIFYSSTSHLLSLLVSIFPTPLSHQEVQVACALESALHSLCPTRSHSMNDRTWLSGQCFHSANSPWRNHACLGTWKNTSQVSDTWYRHSVARLMLALHDLIFKTAKCCFGFDEQQCLQAN